MQMPGISVCYQDFCKMHYTPLLRRSQAVFWHLQGTSLYLLRRRAPVFVCTILFFYRIPSMPDGFLAACSIAYTLELMRNFQVPQSGMLYHVREPTAQRSLLRPPRYFYVEYIFHTTSRQPHYRVSDSSNSILGSHGSYLIRR